MDATEGETAAGAAAEAVASAGGSGSSLPMLLGLGVVAAILVLALRFIQSSDKVSRVTETKSKSKGSGPDKKVDKNVKLNPQADAAYLVNCLRPDSTPFDILYAIASAPDSVAVTSKKLEIAAELRRNKLAHLEEEKKKASHKSMDDLFDDEGWAEEDEDDPAAAAAKKAKEEKEKEAQRLAKATGKDKTDFTKVKLEGIDDGVLGQEWVVRNLTEIGAWPPPHLDGSVVGTKKFGADGDILSPVDHPGVRRNLIMTMGRLNAKHLNTHPELQAAGPKGLIDPTYFQDSVEYRQRAGQQLEVALRMSATLRSFRLACSVLDAIVMFKIGLMDLDDEPTKTWFRDTMARQYGAGGVPKLVVEDRFLGVPTPDPPPAAAGSGPEARKEAEKNRIAREIMQTRQVSTSDDRMALEMQITRRHAEAFTKEKVAQAQRQGIPPQIAIAAYREAWFFLVRARRLRDDGTTDGAWDGALGDPSHGGDHLALLEEKGDALYGMLERGARDAFRAEFATSAGRSERRMVIGWPFLVGSAAQKSGRVKIHVPPPTEPGRYEFTVTIRSQEWIGAEEEFAIVVDVAKGTKKKKAEEEEGGEDGEGEGEEDGEGKKDK